MMTAEPLLEVSDLTKHYQIGSKRKGRVIKAVDGISFEISEGKTFALVGESGSGKTTTARVVLGVERRDSGQVLFRGRDLQGLSRKERKLVRRDIGAVFQNPHTSLNPQQTVGWSIAEPLATHPMKGEVRRMKAERRRERVAELLRLVRLSPDMRDRYPSAFSGGQKQRIAIARALALDPALVVLDEPVTALDASVQAQILELLMTLQRELGVSFLFIAHDLAVVRDFCDCVGVMYQGRIVEMGSVEDVFQNPSHPYTRALLSAVPVPDPTIEVNRRAIVLRNEKATDLGCGFAGRCPLLPLLTEDEQKRCLAEAPELFLQGEHASACYFTEQFNRLTVR